MGRYYAQPDGIDASCVCLIEQSIDGAIVGLFVKSNPPTYYVVADGKVAESATDYRTAQTLFNSTVQEQRLRIFAQNLKALEAASRSSLG
jgi:hypothetical protein